MKNKKRIKALLLAAVMLFSLVTLAACGGEGDSTQGGTDAAYRVTVVDGKGNPYTSGVIVRFMRNGEQAAMEKIGQDGTVEKNLTPGDYTVELMFTDSNSAYYYDKTNVSLSAEKTELEIVLYGAASEAGQTLTAQGKEYQAYRVSTGSTYVKLTAGDRSYFLFSPTEAGTYQISVADEDVQLGYYGAPHFVQENNAAEDLADNTFTQSINAGMIGSDGTGTTTLVIGIDSTAATECVLTVERIGDPQWTVSDEPWTAYQLKQEIKPFTLSLKDGQKLTYVDIAGKTADYQLVYNPTDGYYHMGTADGPVVYINLGKNAPNASLQVIIAGDGSAGGAPIRKYFYDANGEFVKKEDYTEILMDYFDCMDETYGVYPLNDDLIYIIQNGCSGWWDINSPNFIFDGCNPELGWLFACCYIEG